MIPVTLNNIANLQDTTTAQTTLNNNNATVTGGFSTALNVTGDQMKGTLDLNSNQIINLPAPATANSPVRLQDVSNQVSVSTSILTGNNVFTGTNSFGAVTVSTLSGTISASTLTVSGTSIFSGSVSLPLSTVRARPNSVTVFVNASTGSDGNTGGSATSAFSTISASVLYAQRNFDTKGITFNVAAGTYNEQVQVESLNSGANMDLTFIGAGSATTTIQAPNGLDCFFVKDYGTLSVSGFTLKGSSSSYAISSGQFAIVDVFSDMVFGSGFLGAHLIASQNATINIINSYQITGSAPCHFQALSGGQIAVNSNVVATVSSALAFSQSFAYCSTEGFLNLNNYSVSGSGVAATTGTKFLVFSGGFLGSAGVDANTMLPGSVSGAYANTVGYDFAAATNTVTTAYATAAQKGNTIVISDATATTPNSYVTGGGANVVLCWWNGVGWRVIGS